jgi:hypothetical protein
LGPVVDGVAQRLIRHAGEPGRLMAIVAVERVGDGHHPHSGRRRFS